MTTLADLHRTVQATLASKRIGTPVFVRYLLNGVLEGEGAPNLRALAQVVAGVGDWLGQPADRLYSLFSGQDGQGQCSLTLQFPNGATALVSEVHGQNKEPGVDLMILGTRGAIYHYHDAGGIYGWEDRKASFPGRRAEELLAAVEETRQKGTNPVAVRRQASREPEPKPPEPAPRKDQAKYGVLLVTGSHTHQENYAAAFAADPRCRLVAVTDEPDIDRRRRELNERLAWALGVPYIADLAKALERKDVQVVSICAPPERRGRIAVRCAGAGKHLYLDKSLVPQLAEADALVAAVRKAGVRSHMFSFISQPWARAAKKLLDAGRLGKLLAIHADVFFAKGQTGHRQARYAAQGGVSASAASAGRSQARVRQRRRLPDHAGALADRQEVPHGLRRHRAITSSRSTRSTTSRTSAWRRVPWRTACR